MTVKQTEETKTYLIYETPTHRFKISEAQLDKMKDSHKWPLNLQTAIQKRMKQMVDNGNGTFWDESVEEIYSVIANKKESE